MSEGKRYSRFELDEWDSRLFRRPQERALVLKRPGRPDLKLSVVLSYVEGSLRAEINGAYTFAGSREKLDPMEMPRRRGPRSPRSNGWCASTSKPKPSEHRARRDSRRAFVPAAFSCRALYDDDHAGRALPELPGQLIRQRGIRA
jgi:hypothetical protein